MKDDSGSQSLASALFSGIESDFASTNIVLQVVFWSCCLVKVMNNGFLFNSNQCICVSVKMYFYLQTFILDIVKNIVCAAIHFFKLTYGVSPAV